MLKAKRARSAGYKQLQKLGVPGGDNRYSNETHKSYNTNKSDSGPAGGEGVGCSAPFNARDVGRLSGSNGLGPGQKAGAAIGARGATPLTVGERRAYRVGVLAGMQYASEVVAAQRIRIAAHSADIETPEFWPERG